MIIRFEINVKFVVFDEPPVSKTILIKMVCICNFLLINAEIVTSNDETGLLANKPDIEPSLP